MHLMFNSPNSRECALGERCVDGNCIKICFYDAHCLAGEYCHKENATGEN